MSHADEPQPEQSKKNKPSVRRACVACHTGKTRCSETLPCQNCVKRGVASLCAYPDAEVTSTPPTSTSEQAKPQQRDDRSTPISAIVAGTAPNPAFTVAPPAYPTMSVSTTTTPSFRPAKRPRPLTEEETASITRNFTRGDFFVGSNAPVRIDPRLPVRLMLGEGDQVHFTVGNYEP
ncbi:Zn(2)-C6 fungal-type domain-containing protein [Mycena indigotica]|uniref:Zn(2)-C6 fungal-type domain-containing protein n=1 Tax=Mycena indigotica TaxID=2126181 RepID=A0A8H6W6D2_9AGAR|nr:Zn(2)-C6 fungal-type domain-containing protein [Mycena indigotica]KAF7307499.1 Zn(2)-C6 fungal-type domain-containing protein [Mycena indigotica]